jgi:hypothetical protein
MLLAWLPSRQVPGYAEITAPVDGQVISGVVTVSGTADHPLFDSYTLSFTYAGTDPEQWFLLGDRTFSPAADGPLGVWDTTHITQAAYDLRLEVWPEGGDPLVVVVHGVLVSDQPAVHPAESPEATSSPVATVPAGRVAPQSTREPAAQVAPASPRPPSTVALLSGAGAAAAALATVGGYWGIRRALRSGWRPRSPGRLARRRRHLRTPPPT